MKKEEKRCK